MGCSISSLMRSIDAAAAMLGAARENEDDRIFCLEINEEFYQRAVILRAYPNRVLGFLGWADGPMRSIRPISIGPL
jgi:hypothetical protein